MTSSVDAVDSSEPLEPSPQAVATDQPSPRRIRAEVLIVLGLSLGQSAVFAAIRLIERYLAPAPIGDQTANLNPSRSDIDYLDLIYQVLRIGFALMPVALAFYLLSAHGRRATVMLGLVRGERSPWHDVRLGVLLAAMIGIPGLVLYATGRALGQTVNINTNGLPDAWWAATILLLSAGVAGILEEVVVVGYLTTRLSQLGWSVPAIILASALLRGGYHLYQGWPMALGNVVMGAVFAWVFLRWKRLGPLIIAHWLLDLVAFVGPEVVPREWLVAWGIA